MGTFEMKGLSLSAPITTTTSTSQAHDPHPESTHDMVLRKTLEAMKNVTKEGWLESSLQEIYKSTIKEFHGVDDQVDWRAKCRAMEFASMVAKGEVERSRQRYLEQVMDALL